MGCSLRLKPSVTLLLLLFRLKKDTRSEEIDYTGMSKSRRFIFSLEYWVHRILIWQWYNCSSLHTKILSAQCFYSSGLKIIFLRASFLSSSAITGKFCSILKQKLKYLKTNINELPGYRTKRIPKATSTARLSTISPHWAQRRESFVASSIISTVY